MDLCQNKIEYLTGLEKEVILFLFSCATKRYAWMLRLKLQIVTAFMRIYSFTSVCNMRPCAAHITSIASISSYFGLFFGRPDLLASLLSKICRAFSRLMSSGFTFYTRDAEENFSQILFKYITI